MPFKSTPSRASNRAEVRPKERLKEVKVGPKEEAKGVARKLKEEAKVLTGKPRSVLMGLNAGQPTRMVSVPTGTRERNGCKSVTKGRPPE